MLPPARACLGQWLDGFPFCGLNPLVAFLRGYWMAALLSRKSPESPFAWRRVAPWAHLALQEGVPGRAPGERRRFRRAGDAAACGLRRDLRLLSGSWVDSAAQGRLGAQPGSGGTAEVAGSGRSRAVLQGPRLTARRGPVSTQNHQRPRRDGLAIAETSERQNRCLMENTGPDRVPGQCRRERLHRETLPRTWALVIVLSAWPGTGSPGRGPVMGGG